MAMVRGGRATEGRPMKLLTHHSTDPDGTICCRIEEVEFTPEERERERRHAESLAANEAWLRGQWPRLIPECLGQWLAVGGRQAFVSATREEAMAWLKANHPDDPG